jgi:hypothetical protein
MRELQIILASNNTAKPWKFPHKKKKSFETVNILQYIVNAALSCLMKLRGPLCMSTSVEAPAHASSLKSFLVSVNYQLKEESLGLWALATSLGTCH